MTIYSPPSNSTFPPPCNLAGIPPRSCFGPLNNPPLFIFLDLPRLLKDHNISFKELNVPYSFSQEEFHALVKKHSTTKTVPKVFFGEELIGGYEELVDWVENHSGGYGDGSL